MAKVFVVGYHIEIAMLKKHFGQTPMLLISDSTCIFFILNSVKLPTYASINSTKENARDVKKLGPKYAKYAFQITCYAYCGYAYDPVNV